MSAKLLKGRYTATDSWNGNLVGEVRYLDPRDGTMYSDEDGERRANSGFRAAGDGRWVSGTWAFVVDSDAATPSQYIPAEQPVLVGYVISSANGAPTVLHSTQKIAEAEALRLAQGNTGVEFTVYPVYRTKAVSKAYTPKPVAKLEKL